MYLNAHTYFSLRWGTLSPESLVRAAKAKGMETLALTDINNTSCAYQFVRACKKYGVKPILGIEFRREQRLLYIGLARNPEGWRQLCQFLTSHSLKQESLPDIPPVMVRFLLFMKRCRRH